MQSWTRLPDFNGLEGSARGSVPEQVLVGYLCAPGWLLFLHLGGLAVICAAESVWHRGTLSSCCDVCCIFCKVHVYKYKTEAPYQELVLHVKGEAVAAIKAGELELPPLKDLVDGSNELFPEKH